MEAGPLGIMKQTLQRIYDAIWAKKILNSAEKVITVDKEHFLASKFGGELVDNKWIEIFNGVDINVFSPAKNGVRPKMLQDLPKEKKVVLFVGNPLPFKRLDFLLRAFKEVR